MSRRLLVWIVLVASTLGYPLVVLGGGAPRFPSRADCVHPATSEGNVEAACFADELMLEILDSGADPAKSDPHRLMLGAGGRSLAHDSKSRRAHRTKLDLGSGQTHAVDQYIPLTAFLGIATIVGQEEDQGILFLAAVSQGFHEPANALVHAVDLGKWPVRDPRAMASAILGR